MADDDDLTSDPPRTGPLAFLGKFWDGLRGRMSGVVEGNRSLILWSLAAVAGLALVIIMIGVLAGSLDDNGKKQVETQAIQDRGAAARREEAIKVAPVELSKLLMPNMLSRIENGDYTPVFPPKPKWSLADLAAYLPQLRQVYLEALRQKNQKDFEALIQSIK